ncbi:MAG: Na+/H+ antiporter NhaA [Rhodoglobus sp.]|nr:Na+/H+ antiporter NhaA [Rhodoglobus sp.]
MPLLRSERVAAALLLGAAVVGLLIANSGLGPLAFAVEGFRMGPPGLELSVGHWIKDGLLAVFFFLASIELRHELRHGELDSPRKALVPTVAAVGGVVVPAVVFLVLVQDPDLAQGWPIPTATDIAFALGVLAIVGRGLPPRFRALLLALAVIDDLIAILIIAVFFTTDLLPLPLLVAVPVVMLFGWLSYRAQGRWWAVPALVVLGVAAWILVYSAGIHPTIAGVALGLIMSDTTAARTRHAIEPWSNLFVLPLFAFVAALVPFPHASPTQLSPAFWAIIVALPLGKLVGITAGAAIATSLSRESRADRMPLADLVAVAGLGGIGFTVSLLMNELAYESQPTVADEVTLAVLGASLIAAVIGGVLTALRSRHYSRRGTG